MKKLTYKQVTDRFSVLLINIEKTHPGTEVTTAMVTAAMMALVDSINENIETIDLNLDKTVLN